MTDDNFDEYPILWDRGNIKHIFEERRERKLTVELVESLFKDEKAVQILINAQEYYPTYRRIAMFEGTIYTCIFEVRDWQVRPISVFKSSNSHKNAYIKKNTIV